MAVPGDMTAGEFKYMVQKLLKDAGTEAPGPAASSQMPFRSLGRAAEQTIYIFVNGVAPTLGCQRVSVLLEPIY